MLLQPFNDLRMFCGNIGGLADIRLQIIESELCFKLFIVNGASTAATLTSVERSISVLEDQLPPAVADCLQLTAAVVTVVGFMWRLYAGLTFHQREYVLPVYLVRRQLTANHFRDCGKQVDRRTEFVALRACGNTPGHCMIVGTR